MLVNSSLTVYHKTVVDRENKWVRYNYEKIWWFGGKGAGLNKGYENANDVQIRIPYDLNPKLDYANFGIGDILVQGTLTNDITSERDIKGEYYNITSLNNNIFGNNKHIHIGGK